MLYLWNAILEADKQNKKAYFVAAKHYTMCNELMNEIINVINLNDEIPVNLNFRFSHIFNLYLKLYDNVLILDNDKKNAEKLMGEITNLLLHFLGRFDLLKGITKEEIIYSEIEKTFENSYGKHLFKFFKKLNHDEKRIISKMIYKMHRINNPFIPFEKALKKFFDTIYIYQHKEKPANYILYISNKKSSVNEDKLELIKALFFDATCSLEVFWEYHFGIIGINETMKINQIAIY